MHKQTTRLLALSLIASTVLLAGCNRAAEKNTKPVNLAQKTDTAAVAAVVNGEKITEAEIQPLLQNGMDRSVAINRRITQAVVAQATAKRYNADAEAALSSLRNDLFMQIYSKNGQTNSLKKFLLPRLKTSMTRRS